MKASFMFVPISMVRVGLETNNLLFITFTSAHSVGLKSFKDIDFKKYFVKDKGIESMPATQTF